MKICIAEKPSVAKEIAIILGANSRRDGYFEGNGYQVTWTFGHLCTLKEPHDYDITWKRWHLATLPMMPLKFGIKVIDNSGVQKQFNVIESLVKNAEEVINCGDAGQEGELIQRWVLHKAKSKAPLKRLWISSLTEEAIREGFSNLKDGNDFDPLYKAGMARAVGDWLLGMNATRAYTLKFGQGQGVLSIGRVQTPTLALVVSRHKEITEFEPSPFWELKTTYRDAVFNVKSGRFEKKEDAIQKLDEIKGFPFEVTNIETKKGKEHPPKLFDLTLLQVECNKKYGFTAEETLRYIQSLYEKKLTTYPRVDTTFLSNDIYKKIPSIMGNMEKVYASQIAPLVGKPYRKSKKVFDDKKITDHHAIIPTGVYPSALTKEEKLVYHMVSLRFISVFYPDCEISNTTVEGVVNKVEFKTTGKQILKPGWRVLFPKGTSKDDKALPVFEKGEKGSHVPDLLEKETQPPKYFTEASLLRAMETAGKSVDDEELRDLMKENGIGRPSTRANIIETLFRRKYIYRDKKRVMASQTGVDLINTIENQLLKSAELTGAWEKKLRDIELGNYDPSIFLMEMRKMVWDTIQAVKFGESKVIHIVDEKELKSESKKEKKSVSPSKYLCPICKKGDILKGKSAWGCSCHKDGCHFILPFVMDSAKITQKQMETFILKKRSGLISSFKGESGSKYSGYLVLNNQNKVVIERKEEDVWVCPKCKTRKMIKGKSAYGCEGYNEGCRFIVPFEISGKKLTDTQFSTLIKKGKSPLIKGFVDVNQNKFDGYLLLDSDYRVMVQRKD
ncbi:DNA topoisomerase 3 [Halosquirtibacter xylanolyticus]|uniref:type IA DNA topoisomerase n=1 Tax=Halosquirtibacter xylanolyticus TaxID=3374599 RepID=UPI003747C594|nr:DNA topoisomerase 3 [Prolixibacteraceae bacterium]